MKTVICGGRNVEDRQAVEKVLDGLTSVGLVLVSDASSGVPLFVRQWCEDTSKPYEVGITQEDRYGPSAVIMRNKEMVEQKPDLCIAFPGGSGTIDLVKRCKEAGVRVWEVSC